MPLNTTAKAKGSVKNRVYGEDKSEGGKDSIEIFKTILFDKENRFLFDYDAVSGILRLNKNAVPEGTLEKITKQIENGEEVYMKIPPILGKNGDAPRLLHLKGIKKAIYLSNRDTERASKPLFW